MGKDASIQDQIFIVGAMGECFSRSAWQQVSKSLLGAEMRGQMMGGVSMEKSPSVTASLGLGKGNPSFTNSSSISLRLSVLDTRRRALGSAHARSE